MPQCAASSCNPDLSAVAKEQVLCISCISIVSAHFAGSEIVPCCICYCAWSRRRFAICYVCFLKYCCHIVVVQPDVAMIFSVLMSRPRNDIVWFMRVLLLTSTSTATELP